MFWLYLLLRPRRRYVTVNHVRWKHPRFHRGWYWLTGAFLVELAAWELAGELLAAWWLLWLAARYGIEWTYGRSCVQWEVPRWLEVSRSVWPKRAVAA